LRRRAANAAALLAASRACRRNGFLFSLSF
jgi:hypothetical protein